MTMVIVYGQHIPLMNKCFGRGLTTNPNMISIGQGFDLSL